MQVTTIRARATVKLNLMNFGNADAEVELTAILDDGDDPQAHAQILISQCRQVLVDELKDIVKFQKANAGKLANDDAPAYAQLTQFKQGLNITTEATPALDKLKQMNQGDR